MLKKGIDISEHNGYILWEITKNFIDFAIVRVTFGKKGIDKMYIRNIENLIKYEIPFGVYVYSYALNLNDAVQEANFILEKIKDYKDKVKFIAIDMEDADLYKKNHGMPSNEMLTSICKVECDIFKNAGYNPFIYASKYYFDQILNKEELKDYKKWLAWWNRNAVFDEKEYSIWQYTSTGEIEGIDGRVDLNIMYDELKEKGKELLINDLKNYPDYAKGTLLKLIEKGVLLGDGKNINLSTESVRLLVIIDRLGLIN